MALKVYKASAGTGKTYRLALTYLKLLLGDARSFDPNAFSRILAVTFTNKATEEMKTRILETLRALALGRAIPMADDLVSETGLSVETITERAQIIHERILHRYAFFSVSTLDAFFQRILHAFELEAGLSPGYSVDLDTPLLIEKTAAQVTDEVLEDESLRDWLSRLIREKVNSSEKWDVNKILQDVGYEVVRESFRSFGSSFADKLSDKSFLKQFLDDLRNITGSFRKTMASYGEQALTIIHRHGFTPDDFPYKTSSFAQYFNKISQPSPAADSYIPGSRVLDARDGVDNMWKGKSSPPGIDRLQDELMPVLIACTGHFQDHFPAYATAVSVLEQLPKMGLLADVSRTMRRIQAEENKLNIGDSTYLLSQLAGDGNAPFIYEKMGAFFSSFLLDEFQDTSYLQWKNIRPLLLEGLAQGDDSLIVGDVKQSIYRWRNSDWRILGEEVVRDSALQIQGVECNTLRINWRSRAAIVDFVNTLIDGLRESLTGEIKKRLLEYTALDQTQKEYLQTLLERAYESHREDCSPATSDLSPGYVRTESFYDNDQESSCRQSLDALQKLLASLQDRGYSLQDIILLVRTKKDGQILMDHFLRYRRENPGDTHCYDFISADSLRLDASPYVRLSVALLRKALYPGDDCNTEVVRQLERQLGDEKVSDDEAFTGAMRSMPVSDAFEAIVRRMGWMECIQALPYLQELHDVLLAFSDKESGGLYAFLRWWENKGHDTMLTSEFPGAAIRILTIHKAKGLEAPVVIVPFCNWKLDTRAGNYILWAGTEQAPFNRLEKLPVTYKDNLLQTYFAGDYFTEYAQRLLDALNMLYVAITRPADELYLFLVQQKKSTKEIAGHIEDVLGDRREFGEPLSAKDIRQRHNNKSSLTANNVYSLKVYPSGDFNESLKLAYREDEFDFSQDSSMRQWGIILHKALSRMTVQEDAPRVLEELVAEGELSGNVQTVQQYAEAIARALSNSPAREWFDGSWTVRNEIAILGPEGQLRPDRILEKNGRMVVIDYKFGQPHPSHQRQINSYVAALRRMGFQDVEGHLWYITL